MARNMPPEEYSYTASILRLLRNRPFILLILTYGGSPVCLFMFLRGGVGGGVLDHLMMFTATVDHELQPKTSACRGAPSASL